MVKLLGVHGKIIVTILYVYCCEIHAEVDKLEFWEPNSEFDTRRGQQLKKKSIEDIPDKPLFRYSKAQGPDRTADKFTRGFRAEMHPNTPKHHSKHARSHVGALRTNINMDVSAAEDENKNRNVDKNHNAVKDKKHVVKHHDGDKTHGVDKIMRNRNAGVENTRYVDTHHDESYTIDKYHIENKKRNGDKHRINDETYSFNENHDIIHNVNNNNNQYIVKKSHKDQDKDKSHLLKEKMLFTRIPKLQPEAVKGQILDKWPTHHHKAKLRTQEIQTENDEFIQSTRMTPMYLMQQPPEDDVKTEKKDTKGKEDSTIPESLSPYALTAQMKHMMDEFSDANATIETIGRTVEYNDIVLLKITERKSDIGKYFRAEESKYIDEVPEKKIIFIVHGLSVMGMSKMENLHKETNLKILMSYYFAHLDKFDIFFMPMANPDGYSATHSTTIWNKNMSPQEACPGVMLDRNFDVAWNATRQISSCSQLYPGSAPFSETETKAVRDVFHYHGHKILAYIHVHAGTYSSKVFKGDAILYPRGFTEIQSDDDKYIDLKGEIDEAMKNASFQVMSVTMDTLHNWYGKVTGSSVDYASAVYGIPYALEFVMQLYEDDDVEGNEHETNEYYALTEIWRRLIDSTFNNMWKNLHTNEVRRK